MSEPATAPSLARHHARLLAAVFILFELLVAGAVVLLLMAPMARRAADDLAGLMLLSAQTWSELPPETRTDFEIELANTHLLMLNQTAEGEVHEEWHGFYLYFLELALEQKTGWMQHLSHSVRDDESWFWATLPSGNGTLAVGFPERRVGTHPLRAMLLTLAAGLVLAILAALGLARKITSPLARLEQAISQVGLGETPEWLPETGPRELASLSRRFNQMAHQVQELLVARTTMLAGISHDLRTPLARIRLAIALLESQPSPALIARIEQSIDEMDRLIGDVLSLSREFSAETISRIDLAELLSQLAAREDADKVVLSLPDHPVPVMARPLALRRAAANLLDNALRYGGAAPVSLCLEQREQSVCIGILDRGPGIPTNKIDAVFEPFYRLETSRSPETGGSGLGLAIVRQLANANGWRVELANRTDGGLAAWVCLPAGGAAPPS